MALNIKLKEYYFLPKDFVLGTLTWDVEKKQPPKEVFVRLKWVTQGKGNEDMQVIAQEKISHPGPSGSYDFSLRLPQFPWSYEGQLFSIKWCIEAEVDKATQRVNIICSPKKTPLKANKTRPDSLF